MVSQYTFQFADELRNRIKNTFKGRATKRDFFEDLPIMLELIQLVEPENIAVITVKSILYSVHRCESSTPKEPVVVGLISTRIKDKARASYYNNAPEEVLKAKKKVQRLLLKPN